MALIPRSPLVCASRSDGALFPHGNKAMLETAIVEEIPLENGICLYYQYKCLNNGKRKNQPLGMGQRFNVNRYRSKVMGHVNVVLLGNSPFS